MRRGVRAVTLRGLWVHPRSGLPYYRSRRGGKTTLTSLPPDLPHDHPEFIAAWAAAAKGANAPRVHRPGTLGSTWAAVIASETLHARAKSYRSIIEREARLICDRAADVRISVIEPRHVRADLRAASNPGARLRAWRFWATHCISMEWLETDPTIGIKRPARANRIGHPAWSRDEVAAFRAAHAIGTTPRAIMELLYWTGARISDVVRIGPQHVQRDGVLVFQQTKTGGDLAYVPWSCALPVWAAPMAPDRALCCDAVSHMAGGMTFLQTAHGRPRSHKSAGQDIGAACRNIGLARSAHGLRKARAVALAEAGATATQIAAWTGHRSLSEVSHYTAEADRRRAIMGTGTEREVETMPDQVETTGCKVLKSKDNS